MCESREDDAGFSDCHEEIEALTSELKEIMPTLKKMAEAWESASWFAKAIKWTGGIAAAIAGIIALFKVGTFGK